MSENGLVRLLEYDDSLTVFIRISISKLVLHVGNVIVHVNGIEVPYYIDKNNICYFHAPNKGKFIIYINIAGTEASTFEFIDRNNDIYLNLQLSLKRIFPPTAQTELLEESKTEFDTAIKKTLEQKTKDLSTLNHLLKPPKCKIILKVEKIGVVPYSGEFIVSINDNEYQFGLTEAKPTILTLPEGDYIIKITMTNVKTGKIEITLKEGEIKFYKFFIYKKLISVNSRIEEYFIFEDNQIDMNIFKENNLYENQTLQDENKNTIFHYLARLGDFKQWNEMISKKNLINNDFLKETNHFGLNCFHISIIYSNFDIAQDCLRRGISIHCKDSFGNSALHLAIYYDNLLAVYWLISNGIDLKLKNHFGDFSIFIAHYYDRFIILQYLLFLGGAGFDVNCSTHALEVSDHLASVSPLTDPTYVYYQYFTFRKFYYGFIKRKKDEHTEENEEKNLKSSKGSKESLRKSLEKLPVDE